MNTTFNTFCMLIPVLFPYVSSLNLHHSNCVIGARKLKRCTVVWIKLVRHVRGHPQAPLLSVKTRVAFFFSVALASSTLKNLDGCSACWIVWPPHLPFTILIESTEFKGITLSWVRMFEGFTRQVVLVSISGMYEKEFICKWGFWSPNSIDLRVKVVSSLSDKTKQCNIDKVGGPNLTTIRAGTIKFAFVFGSENYFFLLLWWI